MIDSVHLRQLVEKVTDKLRPIAIPRRNSFVNDIDEEQVIFTDERKLAHIFSNMLETVICFTDNDCLRITSSNFGDHISLTIRHRCRHSFTTVGCNMSSLQHVAEKLHGYVLVNSDANGVTIVLSFSNALAVA